MEPREVAVHVGVRRLVAALSRASRPAGHAVNQTEANVEGRNIGTLAVIALLLERMNVAQFINQHLPADPQAEYGNVHSVLIAARMFRVFLPSNT